MEQKRSLEYHQGHTPTNGCVHQLQENTLTELLVNKRVVKMTDTEDLEYAPESESLRFRYIDNGTA